MRSGGNSGRPSASACLRLTKIFLLSTTQVCKFLDVEAVLSRSAVKAVAIVQL